MSGEAQKQDIIRMEARQNMVKIGMMSSCYKGFEARRCTGVG